MKIKFFLATLFLSIFLFLSCAQSVTQEKVEIKLPSVINSHMVLQRGQDVPLWGWTTPGAEVTVNFAGQTVTSKANEEGRFDVKLSPLKAKAISQTLTIEAGTTKKELKDILVGEVWLCSGQSNMEWPMNRTSMTNEDIRQVNEPTIRVISFPHRRHIYPQKDVPGQWEALTPKRAPSFSAVAYHFAKRLQKDLNVPIGLIDSSWGGTKIEPWTPAEGFKQVKELKSYADRLESYDIQSIVGKKAHIEAITSIKEWIAEAEKAIANGKTPPPQPQNILTHSGRGPETQMFNAMINPVVGFAIKGAIWYQGESNMGDKLYDKKMVALIGGWRKMWKQGSFPFYFVQLAPFGRYSGEALGALWECQSNVLTAVKNTGMAVTTDIGNLRDIHPKNKHDVGRRLALWALAKNYGKNNLVYSGPLYSSHQIQGNKIIIQFKYADSGLIASGNEVKDVFIRGQGKNDPFKKADVTINGSTLEVSHKDILNPGAVRMGWNKGAMPNLKNKEGLPASPFRTDGK